MINKDISNRLAGLSEEILQKRKNHNCILPVRDQAQKFADDLMQLLFPHFSEQVYYTSEEIQAKIILLQRNLKSILKSLEMKFQLPVEDIAGGFTNNLPEIHRKLWLDAEAIYRGDPAAENLDEVIFAYPGFLAISVYRIAHELYKLGVPVFPRILTEYAHQQTGIDIHPGAVIGERFFIDHGTGVVIGETTVIGDNVKIYQGVTLGALSVDKKMSKQKRHPTIGNNVVIYSQAVILGGETVIGHDSIIGGNVWLTESVPPYSVVYHKSQIKVRNVNGDMPDFVI